MRADNLVQSQLLIAQGVFSLAQMFRESTGIAVTSIAFAELPVTPVVGMVACINDSTVNTWGSVIAAVVPPTVGSTVLGFYNGTNWTVIGK